MSQLVNYLSCCGWPISDAKNIEKAYHKGGFEYIGDMFYDRYNGISAVDDISDFIKYKNYNPANPDVMIQKTVENIIPTSITNAVELLEL
jgi:hypothetical protein